MLYALVAGIVAGAILRALALLFRKVGPERGLRWAAKLRWLGWPLITFVFFATALTSAIVRETGALVVSILSALLVLGSASAILFQFGPVKIRRLASGMRHYAWPILAGMFFITTMALVFIDTERTSPTEQIVFVVDLADEEMLVLRDVLDELEPELGAKVFLMSVGSSRYVARLDKMTCSGDMKWDLIAADNNMLGILAAKGLVEELSEFREYDELIPQTLLPSLRPLLKFEGIFYFAPFRPNVKIAFYNEEKFAQYGLSPPKDWDELLNVAMVFKEKEGVGRVAIQGYPGKCSAVTVFEFVEAAGGDALALDDDGSREAFTFLQQLEPYLAPEYVETRFDTANELLIDEHVYLAANWTFGIKVIVEDAGKKQIKAYPGWWGPETEVHVLGGDVLAIPKGAPNPNQAIKLIELLLSKETQQALLSRLRWLPVRFDSYYDIPSELAPYFDAVLDAVSFAVARPTAPQWTVAEKVLDSAFGGLIREGEPIASLEEYSASMKEIPSEYIRYRVEPGDTFELIASRHNTAVAILADANLITSGTVLCEGQILLVPR